MGYYHSVKKRCLLVLLSVILLFSCSTMKTEGTLDSVPKAGEGEMTAVKELVSDMLDTLDNTALTSLDIASALDDSYMVYNSYLPAFDSIRERYLSSVISILGEGVLSALKESVADVTPVLGENASRYFAGEPVTPDIETATRDGVASAVMGDSRYIELLAEAGKESLVSFSNVQKSYSILSLVGKEIELPEVKLPGIEVFVNLILDKYYLLLSSAEGKLRDNPFYGESEYSLFWGEKDE